LLGQVVASSFGRLGYMGLQGRLGGFRQVRNGGCRRTGLSLGGGKPLRGVFLGGEFLSGDCEAGEKWRVSALRLLRTGAGGGTGEGPA
jgi:hypothetical protein